MNNNLPQIAAMAKTTTLTDPAAIAELMMGLPQLGMLDCDHAFIAAGAFMAALKNSPYGGKITENEVSEALERTASRIVKESCSQTGVCGTSRPSAPASRSFSMCGSERTGSSR